MFIDVIEFNELISTAVENDVCLLYTSDAADE